jgi:hypothetical protein
MEKMDAAKVKEPFDLIMTQNEHNEESDYQVGGFFIYIATWEKVNYEYQKVCKTSCENSVKGFANFTKKEIWSIASFPTLIHEFKHIMEGQFHE